MGASLICTGHWDRQLGTSSGPAWFWAALPDKEREAAEGQAQWLSLEPACSRAFLAFCTAA